MIATDVSGKIAYWNGAAESLYGWSAAEVRGRDITEVTPAEISRKQGEEIMRNLAAGDIWSGVFPVCDRQGRQFEAAVTDLPIIKGGAVIGVIGVSKKQDHASSLAGILAEFVKALERLWPRQIEIVIGEGLESATVAVGDPHLLHLLALMLIRELHVLDGGEPMRFEVSWASKTMLDRFGVTVPASRWVHICLTHRTSQPVLRDALRRTPGSQYAATLVAGAGGRLFIDATPAGGTASHLFLPIGI